MSNTRTNEEWLAHLTAGDEQQEAAIKDLRDLLLRAALYFFSRNLGDFQSLSSQEILQRAEDCAQDALIAVLKHLADFRGDSKFTTWAYKFAINKALMAARHERWKAVSLDEFDVSGELSLRKWMMEDKAEGVSPEQSAVQVEIGEILRDIIEHELTEKQRRILVLMVFHDIPMDEVVRRLSTNRNAVYKMLHDARLRLKSGLQARGFEMDETFTFFRSAR